MKTPFLDMELKIVVRVYRLAIIRVTMNKNRWYRLVVLHPQWQNTYINGKTSVLHID